MSNLSKNFASVSAMVLGLICAVGCGQKVTGTYALTQQGQMTQQMNCSSISLNLNSSSNQVVASGNNGTCQESLTGIDNGNGTISVSSLTMSNISTGTNTSYYSGVSNVCTFTGILTVSGNIVSGTLQSSTVSGSSYSNPYCGTVIISGTRN